MPTFAWLASIVKRHWKVLACLLGVGVLVYAYLFVDRGWTRQLKKLQEIHQGEVKAINAAHEEERIEFQRNAQRLQDELKAVQQLYDQQRQQLEMSRRREVVRIVTQYKDDPRGLTREFGQVMGFQVQEVP